MKEKITPKSFKTSLKLQDKETVEVFVILLSLWTMVECKIQIVLTSGSNRHLKFKSS